MSSGRPPKYKTPEQMAKKIADYFTQCNEANKLPTKAGMAVALDITRESLSNYEERDGFFDTIKGAYLQMEDIWINASVYGKNAAGPIFYLKNAFGYRDRNETEYSGNIQVEISFDNAYQNRTSPRSTADSEK